MARLPVGTFAAPRDRLTSLQPTGNTRVILKPSSASALSLRTEMMITYRDDGEVRVPGKALPAFIHNGPFYFLTNIIVYADSKIECWGLVDFNEFKNKLRDGWVVTTLPDGAEVCVSGQLTCFNVAKVHFSVPEREFLKEVIDVIEELNGRPTSLERFLDAKREYWASEPEANIDRYLETLDAIPAHRRKFAMHKRDYELLESRGRPAFRTVWELKTIAPGID